jgi:cytochrome b6-f complex iron-sulfur subunit
LANFLYAILHLGYNQASVSGFDDESGGRPSAGLDRRLFLQSAMAACAASLCPGVLGCGPGATDEVELPSTNANHQIVVALADIPQLKMVGSSVIGRTIALEGPLILVREDQTTIVVCDATCTHAGCNVAYNGLDHLFECPCHGSHYQLNGTADSGPAVTMMTGSLRAYPAAFDGTTLTITVP